jgi:hypothetical protein
MVEFGFTTDGIDVVEAFADNVKGRTCKIRSPSAYRLCVTIG